VSDKREWAPRRGRRDTKVRLHDIHNPAITKPLISGPALDANYNSLLGLAVYIAYQPQATRLFTAKRRGNDTSPDPPAALLTLGTLTRTDLQGLHSFAL